MSAVILLLMVVMLKRSRRLERDDHGVGLQVLTRC